MNIRLKKNSGSTSVNTSSDGQGQENCCDDLVDDIRAMLQHESQRNTNDFHIGMLESSH